MTSITLHVIYSYPNNKNLIASSVDSSTLQKQALFMWQPQNYDDAVTFAKQKHNFADTDSHT